MTGRRNRGRVAMAGQHATVAVTLLLGLFAAAWPDTRHEPAAPHVQTIRTATADEVKAAELRRALELWRAELEATSP